MRIEMDPGWESNVGASTDALFRDHLGPAIRDDAKRYAPKLSGALAGSIEDHVEDHTLVVSATGSDERDYALYVESGHRIVAWGNKTGRVQPPQPFLRPALYQERSA
jgi:hypothetical protein